MQTGDVVVWYEFENGFTNKVDGSNFIVELKNTENVEIENGYLRLYNTYDGDSKRYIKLLLNTNSTNILIAEKKTKLTTKDNYTQSTTLFSNTQNERLSIEYNNYHYNNGDLSIFSSAKILWKWDDVSQKWQAYSVEPSL